MRQEGHAGRRWPEKGLLRCAVGGYIGVARRGQRGAGEAGGGRANEGAWE